MRPLLYAGLRPAACQRVQLLQQVSNGRQLWNARKAAAGSITFFKHFPLCEGDRGVSWSLEKTACAKPDLITQGHATSFGVFLVPTSGMHATSAGQSGSAKLHRMRWVHDRASTAQGGGGIRPGLQSRARRVTGVDLHDRCASLLKGSGTLNKHDFAPLRPVTHACAL
eukprot:355993-Chlamydomonas_euryale.AAC.18